MKLAINTLIFHFLICTGLQSQTNVGVNIDSDLSVANIRAYSIGTFDNRDVSYKGSPLLWDEWMYCSVLLNGNEEYSRNDYKVNYDALAKTVYIRIGNQMYNMSLSKITSMKVMMSINDKTIYKVIGNSEGHLDLYEVLYSNEELELVKKTDVEIGKAYYNTALDAGDHRPSLKKSVSLYIYKSDHLFELPRKRKQLVEKYKEAEELKEVVTFFKENRVDLRDDEEVQSALIELNKNK
jgi:hypothetical protein